MFNGFIFRKKLSTRGHFVRTDEIAWAYQTMCARCFRTDSRLSVLLCRKKFGLEKEIIGIKAQNCGIIILDSWLSTIVVLLPFSHLLKSQHRLWTFFFQNLIFFGFNWREKQSYKNVIYNQLPNKLYLSVSLK